MADGQYTQFPIPFTKFDLEGEINTLRDSMSNLESGVNTLEDSVESLENEKQNVLTAGGGITISGNTISTDNDTALTSATKPAQAKAVGDALSEIEEDLAKKANTDGAYEQMTVGNAEQLVSTTFVEDKVPYLFRTSGGSSDIGDREYDKIVGGTVAWNQLIQNGDFETADGWGAFQSSFTVADRVATVTPTAGLSRIHRSVFNVINHKYLMAASFKGTAGEGRAMLSWYGGVSVFATFTGSWQRVSMLFNSQFATTPSATWQAQYGASNNNNLTPYEIKDAQLFDLTKMFGSAIADYLYSLEQSTPGAGIAKAKEWGFFREDYYEYDAGTLKSVEGLVSHDMVGFNLFDENSSDSGRVFGHYRIIDIPALLLGKCTMTIIDKDPSITFPSNSAIGFVRSDYNPNIDGGLQSKDFRWVWFNNSIRPITTNTDGGVTTVEGTTLLGSMLIYPSNSATLELIKRKFSICINLVWSGARNGEYEPYVKHSYPLDSNVILRGITKLDENGEMYYDGDEYAADGTITRRFAEVDLGTLNWKYESSRGGYFWTDLTTMVKNGVLLCNKYTFIGVRPNSYDIVDKVIALEGISNTYIDIVDKSYTDAATFKQMLIDQNAQLVYELAEPTTEQATPFADPQIVNDWGTEEYVVTNPIIPIGHETRYTNNLRDKLQHLPDLAGSDGDYIVRQTGSQMYLIPYGEVKELPDAPETDGTYRLQLTVSGGTPTLAWVAE